MGFYNFKIEESFKIEVSSNFGMIFYYGGSYSEDVAQDSMDLLTRYILSYDPNLSPSSIKLWLNNCDRKKPFMHPDEEDYE